MPHPKVETYLLMTITLPTLCVYTPICMLLLLLTTCRAPILQVYHKLVTLHRPAVLEGWLGDAVDKAPRQEFVTPVFKFSLRHLLAV